MIFVGCGPGAADLLTLRAARAIEAADVVVWGRSLLPEDAVREHAQPGAEIVAWPPATMPEVIAVYERARDEGLVVARLKSGDPMLFGEMAEEIGAAERLGIPWEVVPGVSAHAAAAAALGTELSIGGDVVITSARAAPGGTATAVVLMVGHDRSRPQGVLTAQGLPADTPCCIVHRVTWPAEMLVRCRLHELTEHLEDLAFDGMTLVLAGPSLLPPESG